jgi:transposase-like protein
MSDDALAILARITTVSEMTEAFRDEDRCRRLLEELVWPRGRICPACGYRRSTSIAGRDRGRTKRPGLYQCSNGACHHQFTVTTRTPLHSTKLPLRLWLQGLWLILQSDKGLSSVRLGEALGISQQAAWRMGHALRLLLRQEPPLDGIVEIDEMRIGGLPRKPAGDLGPGPGRGRKGDARSTKTPVLALVQRPADRDLGTQAGSVRAATVKVASAAETARIMTDAVTPDTHLMSDAWSTFVALGDNFAAHDTVLHSDREYVRGIVHVNSAEGFNDRVRRTVAGVFHHISPRHADLYLGEIGFRWSQRIVAGQAVRRTPKGREVVRTLWDRIPPAQQLVAVFRSAVGRQLRRTRDGSIAIKSSVSVFG